MNYISVSLRIV